MPSRSPTRTRPKLSVISLLTNARPAMTPTPPLAVARAALEPSNDDASSVYWPKGHVYPTPASNCSCVVARKR